MGYVLNAKCKICDFKAEISFGGGRLNYLTNNPVPAINVHTEQLENVNYMTEKDNPNYLFYTNSCLKGDNGKANVFQNFDLQLNQVNNYCPNCKGYTFDFSLYLLY